MKKEMTTFDKCGQHFVILNNGKVIECEFFDILPPKYYIISGKDKMKVFPDKPVNSRIIEMATEMNAKKPAARTEDLFDENENSEIEYTGIFEMPDIDGKEYKKLHEFWVKHKFCNHDSIGAKYEYKYIPTGLGTVVTCRCSCGAVCDLSCINI